MLYLAVATFETRRKALSFIQYLFMVKATRRGKKRRKKWVDFVKLKRAHWEPTEHSAVCSVHFEDEDFTNRFCENLDRRLKRDEIGVCAFPTKHAHGVLSDKTAERPENERSKRKVRYFLVGLIVSCSFIFLFFNVYEDYCMLLQIK